MSSKERSPHRLQASHRLQALPSSDASAPLDWLIVGGGIHGVHLAVRLLDEGGVDPERLRILDPGAELLSRWRACAEATGMSYLRSPSMHHLDTDAFALQRFARKRRKFDPGLFAAPYERPELRLFHEHCAHVIERYGLVHRHLRDRAVDIDADEREVRVTLAGGDRLRARRVVLAIGAGEQPAWPAWAPRDDDRIQHIFGPRRDEAPGPQADPAATTFAVVGGGVSAAQVALRLAREGHPVELITRHALRIHQFDSEPGWLGPKHMRDYEQVRDLRVRRKILERARHRGSVPPEIHRALRVAMGRKRVVLRESGVEALRHAGERLVLELRNGARVEVDRLLLATGFLPVRPGGPMIDRLIEAASLPCAPCGYPIADAALRWHPRVHVSGPLAELELGPVARNIAGARRAADRILTVLIEDQLTPPAPASHGGGSTRTQRIASFRD